MAAPTATTTYVVTLTDPMACAAQDSVVLTVVQLPQVDAGTDVDICAGSGIAIGGSPTSTTGVIYTWSPASGLNDASLANPVAMPGTTTVYTVVVNDANQCSGTDSVEVLVNPLPSLDAGPDTGFCPGDPVQLNALGTGSFSWTPATGLNDPNINNPVATPMASTVYTATLTDANGCISSDNVNVAEFPLPAVDAGSDVWLCLGSSTMLQGTGDVGNYAWTPATPLNDPASQTPLASPTVTTMFNFAITDANNCTASDSMLVSVGTDPPIDAGQNATTCTGIPVMLGGAPTSVPGSMFSWLPNTGLSDATSPNPTASPDSTTTYTLTVANDTCTSTAQVTVQVNSIGQAGFEWRLEPGCEALRAFLTDTSTGVVARHWDLLNGTTSDQANTQTFIPYGSTSVVTLTITDANGCNSTASFQFDPATFAEIVHLDDVPNVFTPNGDGQNDMFTIGTNAFLGPCASMRVMNRWGQTLFQSTGNNLAWDGRTQSGEPATAGTYFYVIHVLDLEFKGTVMLNR